MKKSLRLGNHALVGLDHGGNASPAIAMATFVHQTIIGNPAVFTTKMNLSLILHGITL